MPDAATHTSVMPPPPFAIARTQAEFIWEGPKDIVLDGATDEDRFYGWPVLSLEFRAGQVDQLEARSVYANPLDETQVFAILRAVYWDGIATRKALHRQGRTFELTLPARFVRIPLEHLHSWLSAFKGINVRLDALPGRDAHIPVRRLRIELNDKICAIEKVWQAADPEHTLLNQEWNQVWAAMTEALQSAPIVTTCDEDFWVYQPDVIYDLQMYEPARFSVE